MSINSTQQNSQLQSKNIASNNTVFKGIGHSKKKQVKKSILSMKFRQVSLSKQEELLEAKNLRNTQTTKNSQENSDEISKRKCLDQWAKIMLDRDYIEKLQPTRHRLNSQVLYLTTSEPETLIDFSNTCFFKETMTISRTRVKRKMSDLITYEQFRKEEEGRKYKVNAKKGITVTEWTRDKLTALRNFEKSKNASPDVFRSCLFSRSLQGKMRKSQQRIIKALDIQRFKRYETVCGRPSIQF